MHLGAELLELLLMGDAEMLLLVDDNQAEVPELHGLAEERMGADDNVDIAVGEALLHRRQFLGRNEARGLRDLDRIAAQPLGKRLEMLAGEQSRRHHDRDLLAVHGGGEGGAQRHFGLAEADIAADEPVHRPAGGQVRHHRGNGRLLVVGFVIGKARGKFVVDPGLEGKPRRLVQSPRGGDLYQFAGDLADPIFHPRFARLPGGRAEPVKFDAGRFRAVARQKLDILHRQEQLVAAGIVDFETIVRRAGGLDGAKADKAADAVIDVNDNVARGKAGDFGDEIFRAFRSFARADEALA
jgi:hypothetical protein